MKTYQVTTAATTYPISLTEAKSHLKVDTSADDTYIESIIKAATQLSEEYTNRFFINTTIDQTCSNFKDLETLFKSKVNDTVGYGSSASDVPEIIKQAILLTIGNFYENRNSVIIGRIATELPQNVKWLLDTYKVQIVG